MTGAMASAPGKRKQQVLGRGRQFRCRRAGVRVAKLMHWIGTGLKTTAAGTCLARRVVKFMQKIRRTIAFVIGKGFFRPFLPNPVLPQAGVQILFKDVHDQDQVGGFWCRNQFQIFGPAQLSQSAQLRAIYGRGGRPNAEGEKNVHKNAPVRWRKFFNEAHGFLVSNFSSPAGETFMCPCCGFHRILFNRRPLQKKAPRRRNNVFHQRHPTPKWERSEQISELRSQKPGIKGGGVIESRSS